MLLKELRPREVFDLICLYISFVVNCTFFIVWSFARGLAYGNRVCRFDSAMLELSFYDPLTDQSKNSFCVGKCATLTYDGGG